MLKLLKKTYEKIGQSPGSLIYIGKQPKSKATVTLLEYDRDHLEYRELTEVSDCSRIKKNNRISWLHINGLHDISLIEKIGSIFELNSLVLEDILNTEHRPKFQSLDNHLFFLIKSFIYDDKNDTLTTDQISLILGSNYVLSFQETENNIFGALIKRIESGKGRIRNQGSDYLAYAILDVIIDRYFLMLNKIGNTTEDIEIELIENLSKTILHKIYTLKRELLFFHRSVYPIRELIDGIKSSDTKLIKKTTTPFIQDLSDHYVQIIETIETNRTLITTMLDTYISLNSNKMNEVMKVLTIVATLFIPLTFIVGIYGMNFEYMPELSWRWGYPMIWAIMILLILIMFVFFKYKKWL
jgi:magnesium transporter